MKRVFTRSEIPHLWAHQQQESARTSNYSFYFSGGTIYSYGSHFPIATHVTNTRGERAILFNTARYGRTTSKSLVRQAIPPDSLVFNVESQYMQSETFGVHGWYAAQLNHYIDEIPEMLLKASRAKTERSKNAAIIDASRLHDEATAFAKFYDLDATDMPALDMDLGNLKAAKAALRKAELALIKEREQREQADNADRIAKWRKGYGVGVLPYGLPPLLRVDVGRNIVETSRGARFPIPDAIRGLKLVRYVIGTGKDYFHEGPNPPRLGGYSIDLITKDGDVHAGCHVVSWAEIERLAPELEKLDKGVA